MPAAAATTDVEELRITTVDPAKAPKPRHRAWPGWLYAVVFIVVDFLALAILQYGVTQSSTRVQLSSSLDSLGTMIGKMGQGNFVLLLNMLAIGLVYLILLMVSNRFWVASPILLCLAAVIAAIEKLKISARYEVILPSDLNFLKGNTGDVMSFLPPEAPAVIGMAVGVCAAAIILSVVCAHFDGRHGSMIRGGNKPLGAGLRVLFTVLPALAIALYVGSVGTVDSWGYRVSRGMGDKPSMWDSVYDAQRNGPVVSFLRQIDPKVMDEPTTYSEATMRQIAERYRKSAAAINKTRERSLTDSTVVYVLSESFSDPTRVPGVELNADPMPAIRQVKG